MSHHNGDRFGRNGRDGRKGRDGHGERFGEDGAFGQDSRDGHDDRFGENSRDGHDDRFGEVGVFGQGPSRMPDGDGDGALDEQALRRLLHGAVGDLEPSADALDHLRRAVPARRTRRRQAVVGAAAAVILGATALPLLIHVATADTTADERSTNAASSRQRTHDQNAGGPRDAGGENGSTRGGTAGPDARKDKDQGKDERGRKDGSTTGPTGSTGGTPPASAPTLAASSPTCDRVQLGKGVGTVGAADKEGRVYGAFRVVNVSGTVCAVTGAGEVAAHAQGGAESSRVSVVDHTPGDAAVGLPDPSTEPSQVILQPGQAYEIQFAWIPAADGGPSGCARPTKPTTGPQPTPSAAPGTTDTTTEAKPQAAQENTAPQPPPASVTLSHTPDSGEPKAADATIPDACAGTVYRTGPLSTAPTA
ncbi:hypothetical protein [Streptomyces sp. NPDC053048]|uniref:hypothetical protein n=1 Tax=Streptomyces sp. NPDC053048 TaxID=3365694 RepID=UPI0037D433B0